MRLYRGRRVCLVLVAALAACHSRGRERAAAAQEGGAGGPVGGTPAICAGTLRPPKGACLFEGTDGGAPVTCIEFTGPEFTPSLVPRVCGVAGMRYAPQGCPTAGLRGRCIAQCGQRNEAVHYLYVGTRDSAERACAANEPPGYFLP